MTGKKSAYLYAVLCTLFISSVLISDVSARATRYHTKRSHHGHGHSGLHSQQRHGHSELNPTLDSSRENPVEFHRQKPHLQHTPSFRKSRSSPAHNYSSSSGNSLSGNSGSSKHSYPTSGKLSGTGSSSGYPTYGTNTHGYPTSRPGSLSGSSSSSSGHGYPSTNIGSGSYGYPTSHPSSLSGGGSGSSGYGYPSSSIKPNFGTQLGNAQYPGSSGSHSYPTSRPGSLSGGGSGSSGYGYPTSSIKPNFGTQFGNAQYPAITGKNSSSGSHSYPTNRPGSLSGGGKPTQSVSYPPSSGFSGNTGSSHGSSYQQNTHSTSTSWQSNSHQPHVKVNKIFYNNHHYIYNPPREIHFGTQETQRISYPVYTGSLPSYVFDYSSSGNKYRTLLSGLALYNLGRMSENSNSYHYHENYVRQPTEYCTFGVKYKTGNFEEMAIDCKAITYFIYEDEPRLQTFNTFDIQNKTTVTTQLMYANGSLVEPKTPIQNNIPNTFLNMQTSVISPNDQLILQKLLPSNEQINSMMNQQLNQAQIFTTNFAHDQTKMANQLINPDGSLAEPKVVIQNNNPTLAGNGQLLSNSNQQMSSFTTTQLLPITDTRFSGKPVPLKEDMECYVTRHTQVSNVKKSVPCKLLQEYSTSLRSSSAMLKSSLIIVMVAFAISFF